MSNNDRIERELFLLLRDRRPSLLTQVEVIRDYRRGIATAEEARESAHRLAGTLGLFGFRELGQEASRMEIDLSKEMVQLDRRIDDFVERATTLLSD